MLPPSPRKNLFAGGAVVTALPGLLLFSWLAGLLLCGIVAVVADRLAAWSAPNFSRAGCFPSMFVGAGIAWLTLLNGMAAMALLGVLVLPFMKSADWLWAYWLFAPFLNPVGAFMGAAFATLPCFAIGSIVGLVARVKEAGR
ncbi:hypothetical protein [Dechloromonas sp. H13]|uniref:hypothetical protein n=1 Tax=Dechloromonas sp. H13 TaxID=2570193 RepID=UPI0012929F9A|nr:hypothetical protein [Dechloromonas sp. H13]